MPITQTDIDQLVPELNEIVGLHNSANPDFPLKTFPEHRRTIFLRTRRELEDLLEMDFKNTCALFHREGGKIYLLEDNFEDEIDLIESSKAFNKKLFDHIKKARLALLNLIMHENGHRSCRLVTEPNYIRDFYLDAAIDLYKDKRKNLSISRRLKESKDAHGKMQTNGLRVQFAHPEGKYLVGFDDMDELVNIWFTSQALSNFLCFKDYIQEPELMLTLLLSIRSFAKHMKVTEKTELDALGTLIQHPQYKLFMKDYISGAISKRICETGQESGIISDEAEGALFAQLIGSLNFFREMMALYDSDPKSKPR